MEEPGHILLTIKVQIDIGIAVTTRVKRITSIHASIRQSWIFDGKSEKVSMASQSGTLITYPLILLDGL